MTVFGKFLSVGLGLLAGVLWLVISQWQTFQAVFLIDVSKLQTTEGVISVASKYTSEYRRKTYHHYKIEYDYSVNGRQYHSNKVAFAESYSLNESIAAEYIRNYPAGAQVTVFYDKGDPSFAVLEPQMTILGGVIVLFIEIVGAYFILLGVYYVWKRPAFYKTV